MQPAAVSDLPQGQPLKGEAVVVVADFGDELPVGGSHSLPRPTYPVENPVFFVDGILVAYV